MISMSRVGLSVSARVPFPGRRALQSGGLAGYPSISSPTESSATDWVRATTDNRRILTRGEHTDCKKIQNNKKKVRRIKIQISK